MMVSSYILSFYPNVMVMVMVSAKQVECLPNGIVLNVECLHEGYSIHLECLPELECLSYGDILKFEC